MECKLTKLAGNDKPHRNFENLPQTNWVKVFFWWHLVSLLVLVACVIQFGEQLL